MASKVGLEPISDFNRILPGNYIPQMDPYSQYDSIPFKDLGTSGFRKNGVLSTGYFEQPWPMSPVGFAQVRQHTTPSES